MHFIGDAQLAGGPDWVTTDRWNITATAGRDATIPELIPMLREPLEQRFKLRTHREKREADVYLLTIADPRAGPGPAFRRSTLDCVRQAGSCFQRGSMGQVEAAGSTLLSFMRLLETATGRVVDRTGLSGPAAGLFDFTLRWRPDALRDVNVDQPSLFTALEEQLGLRLTPGREPIEVLGIDSAERPIED